MKGELTGKTKNMHVDALGMFRGIVPNKVRIDFI